MDICNLINDINELSKINSLDYLIESDNININLLIEGVDIDKVNKLVSFNYGHDNNVDTNNITKPFIIKNDIRGELVLSLFERKSNEYGSDGNPIIYALKGLNGWKFVNPKRDIFLLLRHMIYATKALNRKFDTIVLTPSNNGLNNYIFDIVKRYIHFDYELDKLFSKLTVDTVRTFYLKQNYDEYSKTKEGIELLKSMEEYFTRMENENNGIFSFKYIRKSIHRDEITQSMSITYGNHSFKECVEAINNKDILVLDDTVSSGNTISHSANAIREVFTPKSITYLTLFSPLKNNNIRNERI